MFLYDKQENHFDIYDFTGNTDELKNYRRTKINQIPEEERVVFAETHVDPYGDTPLFEKYTGGTFHDNILSSEYADHQEREKSNAYGRYHVLKQDPREKSDKEMLLDSYINGHLANRSVVPIQYLETIKYYLLKNQTYDYLGEFNDGKNYRMVDIIQLPKALYLLQLLEQEQFAPIVEHDLSELLPLFQLSKINEISFEELQKMMFLSRRRKKPKMMPVCCNT